MREQALVVSSRRAGSGRVKATTAATPMSTRSQVDRIKSPPTSTTNATQALISDTRGPDSRSRSVASTSSVGCSAALTKKVDDVFKRLQPHTIVQAYEKLLGSLKIAPSVVVNGELIPPLATPSALSAGRTKATTTAQHQKDEPCVLSGEFHPPSGQFRYAHCLQFAPNDSTLSLATLKALHVSITSAMNRSTATVLSSRLPATLTLKSWRLVTEASNQQLGLALYELSLGSSKQSSLVALVWSQTLEVVKLYLQLNVAELLYTCVQRPIRIPRDDVDPAHGLHAYTVAVTIRTFDIVLWEREFYDVTFAVATPRNSEPTAQVARTQLLDNTRNVYRDRERYLGSSDAALPVVTDALAVAIDTALLVDVDVWEGSTCAPVWGFSKLLSITRPLAGTSDGSRAADFSLSGNDHPLTLTMRHDDTSSGNALSIALEKLSSSGDAKMKKTRVFVQQIDVALSLRFIDATFGTRYVATQR